MGEMGWKEFGNSLLTKGSGALKSVWQEGDWALHAGCSKVGMPNFRFQMPKLQNVSRNKTVFWDVP